MLKWSGLQWFAVLVSGTRASPKGFLEGEVRAGEGDLAVESDGIVESDCEAPGDSGFSALAFKLTIGDRDN